MIYSKGISWIGDCKIPFEDTPNPATNPKYRLEGNYKMPEKAKISEGSITQFRSSLNEIDVKGRFTPNLLVCDDMLNDGNIYKSGDGVSGMSLIKRNGNTDGVCKMDMGYSDKAIHYGDKGSSSRYYNLDLWFNKMIEKL